MQDTPGKDSGTGRTHDLLSKLRSTSKSKSAYIIAALFLLLMFHTQRGWITIKDDAFITFRYSQHLAQGYGLVWNIGEGRVEGYTNFLFMILMAVFSFFKADLVVASKIVNLLSAVLVFFMLIEIFQRIYKDKLLVFFGLFLFVFPYFTAAHIAAGLETMFYAMLVTLACLLFLRQMDLYSHRRKKYLSLVMLAMGLTRPEGVLVAGIIILLELILIKKARTKRELMALGLWFFLPAAAYMTWRVMYFHYLFPNPFYIKKSDKILSLVGLIELEEFITVTKMYVGVLFIPFVSEKARKPLLAIVAILLPSLGVYMFFTPMMNYAMRYYYPYYPIMLPMMAAPLSILIGFLRRFAASRSLSKMVEGLLASVVIVAVVLLVCPYIGSNYFEFKYWRKQGKKLEKCHIYIGKTLGRYPEYRDKYIAIGDAGAISYYSKWKVLDLGGLNDVHLAHSGRLVSRTMSEFSTRMDLDYIFGKDPAIIMVGSSNPLSVDHYSSRILVEDPRFANYKKAFVFEYSPMMYKMIFFKKNDPGIAKLMGRIAEKLTIERKAKRMRVRK